MSLEKRRGGLLVLRVVMGYGGDRRVELESFPSKVFLKYI
jgi:hypothetical protein